MDIIEYLKARAKIEGDSSRQWKDEGNTLQGDYRAGMSNMCLEVIDWIQGNSVSISIDVTSFQYLFQEWKKNGNYPELLKLIKEDDSNIAKFNTILCFAEIGRQCSEYANKERDACKTVEGQLSSTIETLKRENKNLQSNLDRVLGALRQQHDLLKKTLGL